MDENKQNNDIQHRETQYQKEQREYNEKCKRADENYHEDLPKVQYFTESEKPKIECKGFAYGWLIAVIAYLVTMGSIWLISYTRYSSSNFGIYAFLVIFFSILWVPLCIISNILTLKGDMKAAIWLIIAGAFVTFLLVGLCGGMIL